MQSILRVFIFFLVIGVNLLSLSITCYSPSLGSDGHQHTLFHLFEPNVFNLFGSHPEPHSDSEDAHSQDCSLHAHTVMTLLSAVSTCDLCIGQGLLLVKSNDAYRPIALQPVTRLRRDFLSPPEEPPELS